jgi:hypothetical protein
MNGMPHDFSIELCRIYSCGDKYWISEETHKVNFTVPKHIVAKLATRAVGTERTPDTFRSLMVRAQDLLVKEAISPSKMAYAKLFAVLMGFTMTAVVEAEAYNHWLKPFRRTMEVLNAALSFRFVRRWHYWWAPIFVLALVALGLLVANGNVGYWPGIGVMAAALLLLLFAICCVRTMQYQTDRVPVLPTHQAVETRHPPTYVDNRKIIIPESTGAIRPSSYTEVHPPTDPKPVVFDTVYAQHGCGGR